jgi:serine/threonine protein kinase
MYRSMDNRDKTPSFPRQTPRVVIFKVERCNYKKTSWPGFLQKKLYEAHIHRYLSTHSKTAHIVPPYYFSGTLDNHFVTCMGAVEGRSLTGVFRDFGYTDLEPIYNALEKTVKDLWASGVVHGDLHGKNIIVDKRNGRWTVTLLDFGLAMFIPPKIHEAVLGMIEKGNVQNVWETTGLGKFARSQKAKAGYPFFYENSSSLQFYKRETARAAGPSKAGPSQQGNKNNINKNNKNKNNRNNEPPPKRLKKTSSVINLTNIPTSVNSTINLT